MLRLEPTLAALSQEYVLVQAWKKTSAYVRYHNWFADTLAIDQATADLPAFLAELSDRVLSGNWVSDPLRLVPAPKAQRWEVDRSGIWGPIKPLTATSIRPLAHASLSDQVIATAIMLCLSERVETAQGDPRLGYQSADNRLEVVSYGNRLFCDRDKDTGNLIHRWGSSKLYRAYFDDYRSFIGRPEFVAEQADLSGEAVFIVQSDLRQFYDRVRPETLCEKIDSLRVEGDEHEFYDFAKGALSWGWHPDDLSSVQKYAAATGIEGFDKIALPQGLVSAGFFANIILLEFDAALRGSIGREITPGISVRDACRYVDDLRLTVSVRAGLSGEEVARHVQKWLDDQLSRHASGLHTSSEKTKAAEFRGEEQPLIRQARKMQRIQTAISGGFDAAGGEEIIQAVQGLVRSQMELAAAASGGVRAFSPIPDVRDETIGRFAAGRFRRTFRSLRPLLEPRPSVGGEVTLDTIFRSEKTQNSRMTQSDLDEEAQGFALGLINTWVRDPSNVRLLRVAVDLWPTKQVAESIVSLFKPYLAGSKQGFAAKVAFYCLSEILRAGATETGTVPDDEMLPDECDLDGYRDVLLNLCRDVVKSKRKGIPWYLKQQCLLYMMVHASGTPSSYIKDQVSDIALSHYGDMYNFLLGNDDELNSSRYSVNAIVARRSFLSQQRAVDLVAKSINSERFVALAARDLEFARELFPRVQNVEIGQVLLREDLALEEWSEVDGWRPLSDTIKAGGDLNALRNDVGILSFALVFLRWISVKKASTVVTPTSVQVKTERLGNYDVVTEISIKAAPEGGEYRSIYTPPAWVEAADEWKFQLGFLIRYILTAQTDITRTAHNTSWKENVAVYRPTSSHWMQRLYGFYNGHEAFGDNWIPISQFTQDLLYGLLSWPGCRADIYAVRIDSPERLAETVAEKLQISIQSIGEATGVLMLKVPAPLLSRSTPVRPLRACVVQTITPEGEEIAAELTVSSAAIRRKHKNHLATALAAVEKMLDLRDTHKNQNRRLDWLILPELSVHPDDVQSHLVPFARKYKTIILTGLTYHQLKLHRPLVNAAIWIIPRVVEGQGLQVTTRLQGKKNLAPLEQRFNAVTTQVEGFRPCQWLVGYEWADGEDPLWLTGAICYDSTDLALASDLRSRSDVFAIPALNQDVGTFDFMAQALHYHMYQMVVVANNGAYGGSNAYTPQGEPFKRQVFHTHGQPQASISFFEIDDIDEMKKRRELGKQQAPANKKWKFPPAGC